MPGIDPKNIPTLDDIIEQYDAEQSKISTAEHTDGPVESEPEAFDISRFLADKARATEKDVQQETQPGVGDIEDITLDKATDSDVFHFDDPDVDIKDESDHVLTGYYDDNDDYEYEYINDAEDSEQDFTIPVEPIASGALAKEIARQIMPDLEQQLVFLLQKAIEEKLPPELIKPVDSDDATKDNDA